MSLTYSHLHTLTSYLHLLTYFESWSLDTNYKSEMLAFDLMESLEEYYGRSHQLCQSIIDKHNRYGEHYYQELFYPALSGLPRFGLWLFVFGNRRLCYTDRTRRHARSLRS